LSVKYSDDDDTDDIVEDADDERRKVFTLMYKIGDTKIGRFR